MTSEKKRPGVQIVEVPAKRGGQRLDNFLMAQLPGVPKSALYKVIRKGQVRINGKRAKPFQKLASGDQVRIPPLRIDVRGAAQVPARILELLEAGILHEDENYLVVSKPAGIAVHGGSGLGWGLIEALRQSRPEQDLDLAHRLDRDTSGVLVLAKNIDALRHLQEQFSQRKAHKRYLSLLHGRLPGDRWTVDEPLAKREVSGERFMVVDPVGKAAITHFRRLENLADATLVEVEPVTGRTHQIRAHAVFLGAPCAGDARYQSKAALRSWRDRGLQRLFLHAHTLEFEGLDGDKEHFSCPLPDDLRVVLDQIQG